MSRWTYLAGWHLLRLPWPFSRERSSLRNSSCHNIHFPTSGSELGVPAAIFRRHLSNSTIGVRPWLYLYTLCLGEQRHYIKMQEAVIHQIGLRDNSGRQLGSSSMIRYFELNINYPQLRHQVTMQIIIHVIEQPTARNFSMLIRLIVPLSALGIRETRRVRWEGSAAAVKFRSSRKVVCHPPRKSIRMKSRASVETGKPHVVSPRPLAREH